ncbi:MAG: PorT family protein [Chitinophagaceae bacterium]|nr:PorT family protein [Chitinophagaceae bacterium]
MKKIILSLVILATTFFVSQAQVNVGLKGGIGMFNFSGDDTEDFKSKIGPMGGIYAAIPISETFAVAPELQFSGQGAKMEISSIKVNYNLNYLNIPVMFQYRNPSGFIAETGPQIGFLMSAKASADGDEEDIKDSFKGSAFSWGIGLGFKSSMGLGISARYNLNLNNIVDDEGGDVDVKNSGFQVGVFFEFGGKSGNAKK